MPTPFRSIRLLPKSATELNNLTGTRGEIFYDPSTNTLRVFDSTVKGGYSLLKSDLSNISGGGSTSTNVNFGTRTVQSAGFIGTISSISNHDLDDLGNVDVASVSAGQVLYFNGTTSKWEPFSLTSSFNGGSISNPLDILSTTPSIDSTSGALIVAGGVGIGGAVFTGGNITAGQVITAGTGLTVTTGGANITGSLILDSTGNITVNTNKFTVTASSGNTSVGGTLTVTSTSSFNDALTLRTRHEIRFNDTDNSNYTAIRAANNLTASVTYTLPSTDGTTGQVLTTNGTGTLSWATVSGGGGGGGSTNPPGGADGDIQYKNGTAFAGTSTLHYDVVTDTFSAANVTISGIYDGSSTGTITNIAEITFAVGATITEFSTDGDLTSNSDSKVPTEAAVKTYADTKSPINNPTFTGTVAGITQDMVGLPNVEDVALSTWAGSSSITTIGTLSNLSVSGNATVTGNIISSAVPSQVNHTTNKKYVDARAIAMSIALS